ncbi:hypothetical protein SRABI121_01067 [Microbacterium sp. Bi121]|nr:hypothetical protein SRABI121_01067 [Microbacterium sp. Bi121]
MRAVERDDEVVLEEGCRGELPGAMSRTVVPATLERLQRALVRAFADVPLAGAGAARDDQRAQSLMLGEVAEDRLGHR